MENLCSRALEIKYDIYRLYMYMHVHINIVINIMLPFNILKNPALDFKSFSYSWRRIFNQANVLLEALIEKLESKLCHKVLQYLL